MQRISGAAGRPGGSGSTPPAALRGLWRLTVLVGVLSWLGVVVEAADRNRVDCYTAEGRPQRCIPPFVNAAFNVSVVATNTCGQRGPQEYCLQTGITGARKSCLVCEADGFNMHPASYLTDFHNVQNQTWWQSSTMLDAGIQHPSSVNLTLGLGKAFDITYVRLKFFSSRPESFSIYKRTREQGPWIPYQYYSASCGETYGLRPDEVITRADETKAICVSDFSDIVPLTGGSVAFSTLEGRPSAYQYEDSPEIQEWVTAVDIKIVLNRLNTFGEEVFGDPNVLRSYFYAISDFAVGGRCKCNGHASDCVQSTGQGLETRLVCLCEHNTAGANCDECQSGYNDRPWNRATSTDANECLPCDCNGLSNRCFFDEELYRRTGHGGHCKDCRENTSGPKCERCKDDYFRRSERDRCEACRCNPVGSETTQCDNAGRCRCKPGVTGEKCDRCMPNFFEFGQRGCRPCSCLVAGSIDNNPVCLADTGACQCKSNVEGQNCDRCKPGFFGMSEDDPMGCMPCFCYGHTSSCSTAGGYSTRVIHSDFSSGRQRWSGAIRDREGDLALQYNALAQNVGVSAPTIDPVYFLAPERYLGNQGLSYNRYLTFKLRIGEDGGQASVLDVVLEGDGLRVSTPIYSQGNPVPRTVEQEYRFRLSEGSVSSWTPRLNNMEFMRLLRNLTAVKIRGSYTPQGVGFLDDVKLDSAQAGSGREEATNVEQCQCPAGYVGQFCESCAPGYHREPAYGGPYAMCVPCNCNSHSEQCDVTTGRCICEHYTVGDNCERCAPGYYGYALAGTPNDCQKCPCPDNGDCVALLNGDVACINCREGYTGSRCDLCSDGYYGDPQGRSGTRRPCQKCICSNNIDPNAVANCDTMTGECLKCIHNSGGFYCDRCLPGFYGDALATNPQDRCTGCDCHIAGTLPSAIVDGIATCDRNGQCPCQTHVTGMQCRECRDGFWNVDSGNGCESCNCDPTGSYNRSCTLQTGQCQCKPGVSGRRCQECEVNFFGFSREGCRGCDCHPEGSVTAQCDDRTGQCRCRNNLVGRQCDQCPENKFNVSAGCMDCPSCYNLVQDEVNILRRKLNELRQIIIHIGENPQAINDTDFREQMAAVNKSVVDLWNDAKDASGGADGSLSEQMLALQQALDDIMSQCGDIGNAITDATQSSQNGIVDITAAEQAIDEAERRLRDAEAYIQTDGRDALEEARKALDRLGLQSERMTEIARQAREEALNQEEEAERIEGTAHKALDTSKEALAIAQSAIRKPTDVMMDLEQLKREVSSADVLYQQTKEMVDEAKDISDMAYRDSLGIVTDADSIKLPNIDVDDIRAESMDIKEEARQIKEEAARLLEQHEQLMNDVDRQKQEANGMLDNGYRQQQIADELLADADAARDMALKAVAKAEKTLKDAADTLEILKEFNEKVEESKEKAREALKKVPDIEDMIKEAEDKTRDAMADLSGAVADAIAAKEIAERAQAIAEEASRAAGEIRVEAGDTKIRATNLNDQALSLSDSAVEVERKLDEYERQAEEDKRLISEALSKADMAKTSALESSEKVDGALQIVVDILRQLQGLDQIDVVKLDELESQLGVAESQLEAAQIEARFQELLLSREQQATWVRTYTYDLIQLQRDVDNIRVINETIPRKCFKSITLEPTIRPQG